MRRSHRATAAFFTPAASLEDYKNFHVMLCHPKAAKRCINSFNGSILFMPHHYTQQTLSDYDCGGGILTLISYYLLVLVTFTGLSTLLQQTEIRTAEETFLELNDNNAVIVSQYDNRLKVDRLVLDYILRQNPNSSSLKLIRCFDYHFGRLVPISVIMLHLKCDQGLLHLVEVYRVHRWRNF